MKNYKLSELFDMQMGKTPARNNPEYWENGTYPWISIADITANGKYIKKTKEYITDKAVQETGMKPIRPGTVIMSFKLSVGKVARVQTGPKMAFSNEAIMSFEIKENEPSPYTITNEYAYYLLSSLNFNDIGNKAVMGKTLNKGILENIVVSIHKWDEQKKINTELDKVCKLIETRKQQLAKLDELVKSRFVELFGDVIRNSKEWQMRLFADIASSRLGKMLDAKQQTGKHSYPYLANFNVQWFRFNVENLNQMDFDEDDRLEFELKDGDL